MNKLNKAELTLILNQLVKELRNIFGENFSGLVLFGSYAKDRARKDSDLDILILLEKQVKEPLNLIIDTFIEIEYKFRIDISPIFLYEENLVKSILLFELQDYAKILFDKNNSLHKIFNEIKMDYEIGNVEKILRKNYHIIQFKNV